jgi:hypothetical protein
VNEQVWLAAVAEMVDRVRANDWSSNLDQVLHVYRTVPPQVGLRDTTLRVALMPAMH